MLEPNARPGGTPPSLAVFTDFDGTLVEIAETPDGVEVPAEVTDRLGRALSQFDHAFAVITGRDIADIDRYLSPLQLPVAGVHGAQRRRADGSFDTLDQSVSTASDAIALALEPLVQAHPELIVEPKDGSVALHYRRAPELEETCRRALEEALLEHPGFTLIPGKMVYEARPAGLDKGTALRAFMQEEPFAGRVPVFIGDDRTDEDAFRAAQELGGIGIKLGPGTTAARMRIADIASVYALLQGLADISAGGHSDAPEDVPH